MRKLKILFVVFFVLAFFISSTGPSYALPELQGNGRTVQFAGLTWYVKAGNHLGPGPNDWSDDEQSASVDNNGKLHLKIRNIDGKWYSAEIYSADSAKYGIYRFYASSSLNSIDPNVVLGLFLYQTDNKEIDVEVSRWGDVYGPNAQFVVQPYELPGHRERFFLPSPEPAIFEFNWQPDSVTFKALQGTDPNSGTVIHQWNFDNRAPAENSEMKLRLNLWLFKPSIGLENQQDIDVVISILDYPLSLVTSSNALAAQGDGCDSSVVAQIYPLIAQIQNALDSGNRSDALTAIGEARAALDDLTVHCMVGDPPETPTVVAPTTTPGGATITMIAEDDYVTGTVSPSSFCNENYKIALFAETNQWWVQPWRDAPDIPINSDCSWESDTHPWEKHIAAHLVAADYNIPKESLSRSCPPLKGEDILAFVCVTR